jgi:hypothetical protein
MSRRWATGCCCRKVGDQHVDGGCRQICHSKVTQASTRWPTGWVIPGLREAQCMPALGNLWSGRQDAGHAVDTACHCKVITPGFSSPPAHPAPFGCPPCHPHTQVTQGGYALCFPLRPSEKSPCGPPSAGLGLDGVKISLWSTRHRWDRSRVWYLQAGWRYIV